MKISIPAAILLSLVPSAALCCSCKPINSAERFQKAAIVFWSRVGGVESKNGDGKEREYVTVLVTKALKGNPQEKYVFRLPPKDSSCYVSPLTGSNLRLFLEKGEAVGLKELQISLCSTIGNSR